MLFSKWKKMVIVHYKLIEQYMLNIKYSIKVMCRKYSHWKMKEFLNKLQNSIAECLKKHYLALPCSHANNPTDFAITFLQEREYHLIS